MSEQPTGGIAYSPIHAFQNTIVDLGEISKYMDELPDPTPEQQKEYLQAVDGLTEQFQTIIATILLALTQPVLQKIDDDVRKAHVAEREAVARANMERDGEELSRMMHERMDDLIKSQGFDYGDLGPCENPDHDHGGDHG